MSCSSHQVAAVAMTRPGSGVARTFRTLRSGTVHHLLGQAEKDDGVDQAGQGDVQRGAHEPERQGKDHQETHAEDQVDQGEPVDQAGPPVSLDHVLRDDTISRIRCSARTWPRGRRPRHATAHRAGLRRPARPRRSSGPCRPPRRPWTSAAPAGTRRRSGSCRRRSGRTRGTTWSRRPAMMPRLGN